MKRVSLRFAALMAAMMMTMMTSAQQNDSLSTDTTMWFNQTHELSGVVVKGRLPKTRVKGATPCAPPSLVQYWRRPEP